MEKLIRTTLMTGLFLFALLTGLQAQEKYDYAIIIFNPAFQKENIVVSYSNQPKEVISVEKGNDKTERDLSPALKQVTKMEDENWELYNTAVTGVTMGLNGALNYANYVFYLRKKRT